MRRSHIKLILAILAALGVTTGTLLTGNDDEPGSPSSGIALDPDKVATLGKDGDGAAPTRANAAIDCKDLPHWTQVNGGPKINQAHIFCGEWDSRKSRAKGFHARPGGRNPGTVAKLEVSQDPNKSGIYGVRWQFNGEQGASKFSTMFPDRCTRDQVLASVNHAATHQQRCPSGAPGWAWCGPSAPRDGGEGYCTASGAGFTIAGGSLNDGRINTAFPLR